MILKIRRIHTFLFVLTVLIICVIIGITTQAISISKPIRDKKTPLPVIMYHQVLKEDARTGKFVITAHQLENDLKYIKSKGYESITVEQLLFHIENAAQLPKKPIIITFDDGYYSVFTTVLPLLEKHCMKAVVSIIGEAAQ